MIWYKCSSRRNSKTGWYDHRSDTFPTTRSMNASLGWKNITLYVFNLKRRLLRYLCFQHSLHNDVTRKLEIYLQISHSNCDMFQICKDRSFFFFSDLILLSKCFLTSYMKNSIICPYVSHDYINMDVCICEMWLGELICLMAWIKYWNLHGIYFLLCYFFYLFVLGFFQGYNKGNSWCKISLWDKH